MDRAINKSTNKLVDAFSVHKDGSYQNLNRGEWLAPKDSINNWETIAEEDMQVHFVSMTEVTYKSGKSGLRCPHFSVYPNSKAITTEESPMHKLLKNWLFERLQKDDLDLCYSKGTKPHKYENKIKISELDINWNDYEVEVTTKSQKKLRADILLPFNRRHLFLGEGIFFEIQISNQNDKLTYFRSIERALHGYSTCWLFEKDFIIEEDNIQLKDKLIKLNSFSEEIHYAKSGFVSKLKEVIEEQCRFLDEKITETNLHIDKLENTKQEISNNISLKAEELYNQSASRLNSREALLLRKIEQLEGNPFQGLVDSYKKQLEERYEWFIKNTGNAFSNLVAKYTIMLRKLNYPLTLGICPKCNKGYMTKRRGQYGLFYSCSNWNKNGTGCNHIINLKEDDDGEVV